MRGRRGLSSLQFLSIRSIALRLFQAQVRWRRLSDLKRCLPDYIREIGLPYHIQKSIRASVDEVLSEVERWTEKHAQLFEGDAKPTMKERAPRFEHLRTYYYCLQWRSMRYEINDHLTAQEIMSKELNNWPQMKFQFACAYAMQKLIRDDFLFDRHYRATFRTRLAHHPVYDFWLTLLDARNEEMMFIMEDQAPNQKVMLCFRFAVTHGFVELTKYFWDKISVTQREYIGLLQWRALCFRTRSRETLRFLSIELGRVNSVALVRLTWTVFYDSLYKYLTGNEAEKLIEERKIHFLLDNISRNLKFKLLKMENYKAVIDAYYYKDDHMFAYLLENVSDTQVRAVRERVDRIIDRMKTADTNLHRSLLRRQVTIDEASLRNL
ncbi:hypothetical protein PFISCL1PPCAC_17482 [Pristionchus fissidentatus]|uniref:Uncharacterized protein n=1 Tax=Pristionchus fissidentatus TaxID=1538716 RepID=A0AAV5W6A9_9BILA|nr:hypothetical protein PFISCL1PPCAC_17482 [Pristionchus fissidentatus]